MGNNMGAGCGKAAKVMKINGEYFKLKTPIKVFDVIKDYPDHILLDSEEFSRFNLRAKPLNHDYELKPRKIYLLVELPKFPDDNNNNKQSPLRKVRSGVLATTVTKVYRRSVSDDLSAIDARSRSTVGKSLNGFDGGLVGPTRVKMRLPKAQVQRIMQENGDNNAEAAKKILNLCREENAVVSSCETTTVVGEREYANEDEVGRHCYRSKYKNFTS